MTPDSQDAYSEAQNHIDDAVMRIQLAQDSLGSILAESLCKVADFEGIMRRLPPRRSHEVKRAAPNSPIPYDAAIEACIGVLKRMEDRLGEWQQGLIALDEQAQADFASRKDHREATR